MDLPGIANFSRHCSLVGKDVPRDRSSSFMLSKKVDKKGTVNPWLIDLDGGEIWQTVGVQPCRRVGENPVDVGGRAGLFDNLAGGLGLDENKMERFAWVLECR